jgi:hypothetical protein
VGDPSSTVWELTVGGRSAPVNTSWGTTLDVDGDGFADVVVGATGAAPSYVGSAFLYLGGAGGVSTTSIAITNPAGAGADFAYWLASAGDVDGDGFGDLIIGAYDAGAAYVYFGSAAGLSSTPTAILGGGRFGYSVSGVGDVNGDGYADIAIGDSDASAVFVYLGSASGPSATAIELVAPGVGTYFGRSAALAADFNGDGFGDFIVSAPGENGGVGAAYVYLGSSGGLSAPTVVSASTGGLDEFGVVAVGDVNGDGFADALFEATTGLSDVIFVHLGSAAGLGGASMTFEMDGEGTLADVDGDGFADFVASDYAKKDIVVYRGSATGLSAPPASFAGPNVKPFFDAPVNVGDIDRDGRVDVVVGAYSQDDYVGGAYVYMGSAAGLSPTPVVLGAPTTSQGSFGFSVARATTLTLLRTSG